MRSWCSLLSPNLVLCHEIRKHYFAWIMECIKRGLQIDELYHQKSGVSRVVSVAACLFLIIKRMMSLHYHSHYIMAGSILDKTEALIGGS